MEWLNALRRRQPGAPLSRILWWHFLHLLCFLWFVPCYRYRGWGVRRILQGGPLLIVSNHQSFFDPILVGLGSHRRQFYALARSGLFKNPLLGWLIRSLNAIPVEQGTSDTAAMRQCVQVLKQDQALLIFPEGGRTLTGDVEPFEPGLMLLIKRARPTILPVGIAGAYDAWPRDRPLPRPAGRVGVVYGEPVSPEEVLSRGTDEGLAWLQRQVQQLHDRADERINRQSAERAVEGA